MNKTVELIIDDPYKFANNSTVKELEKVLHKLSVSYYNTNVSLIPDNVYDILREVLQKRDPNNEFLKKIGAPISKDKVKLPYFMGSLDKIKPDTGILEKWTKKYPGPYAISDKLDGVSALLVKTTGECSLYTRGDGEYGQNITHLLPYFCKKTVLDKLDNNVAVRGELIISRKNFEKIKDIMANARNAVTGLVNSKRVQTNVAEITEFISYSLINPRYKHIEQFKKLEEMGFNVVTNQTKKELSYDYLSQYLKDRRSSSLYEVDGIVVVDSSTDYPSGVGNPEHGFAFKSVLTDQIAETTVVDVEWNISKDGYLNPRIKVDPVVILGTTITYATALHGKYVIDNVIGPGAVVEIIRAGDVIPNINKVISPAPSGKPKLPSVPYKWSKSGVQLIAKDLTEESMDLITTKAMDHFFKTMGIKYISEGIIKKLVENGYKTVKSIISAKVADLEKIDGIGEKLVTKIHENINTVMKKTDLHVLMAASNIFGRGIGRRKLKVVLELYPNILNEKWSKDTMLEKLLAVDGFDTISAEKFTDGFDKFVKFFDDLNKVIDLSYLKKPPAKKAVAKVTSTVFADMKIVFTGFRDKDLEKIIEDAGGKVTTSVSKTTSIVVYKDPDETSSKMVEAKKHGIKTMSYDEFKKKYSI